MNGSYLTRTRYSVQFQPARCTFASFVPASLSRGARRRGNEGRPGGGRRGGGEEGGRKPTRAIRMHVRLIINIATAAFRAWSVECTNKSSRHWRDEKRGDGEKARGRGEEGRPLWRCCASNETPNPPCRNYSPPPPRAGKVDHLSARVLRKSREARVRPPPPPPPRIV